MDSIQLLVFFTGLVALTNPLANLPLYQSLVSDYPMAIQKRIAIRTTLAVIAYMAIVVWLGKYLLMGLRIDVAAMEIAGGLIIARVALDMLNPRDKQMPSDETEQSHREPWSIVAVVPIAIPLTVGGGTLAYIAATASQNLGAAELLGLSLACTAAGIVIGVSYYFSNSIMNVLGPIGARILVRLAGVVLLAIGVQLLGSGVRGLIPALGLGSD